MNLKILMLLLVYYGMISLFFVFGASHFTDYSSNIALNDSALADDEIDTGGLFGSGISFGRFFLFAAFGVGLPSDTPSWFSTTFIVFQSFITVLAIGFIISSIWNG